MRYGGCIYYLTVASWLMTIASFFFVFSIIVILWSVSDPFATVEQMCRKCDLSQTMNIYYSGMASGCCILMFVVLLNVLNTYVCDIVLLRYHFQLPWLR